MNTANVSTKAIGNANIYQATSMTNSLNDLPSNSNLRFNSTTNDLNLYNPTTLQHSVLYSTYEEANVTQGTGVGSTSESVQYVIQMTTPNWSNNADYYLELPVKLNVDLPATKFWTMDPAFINNNKSANQYVNFKKVYDEDSPDKTYELVHNVESFANGLYPNNAVIQLIKSLQLYGGTNNQPLGKTSMFNQPNLNFISNYGKTSPENAAISGYSGLPISNVKKRLAQDIIGPNNTIKNIYMNLLDLDSDGLVTREINSKFMSSFESLIRMASPMAGAKIINLVDPTNATTLNPAIVKYQNNFVISIPLSKITEFFKSDVSTPPGMPFKFTLDLYTKAMDIYQGTYMQQENTDVKLKNVSFKLSYDTNQTPTIKYRSFVLNPTLQNLVNERWNLNVITYNMETAENVTIQANSWPYSQTIITSSQRPLNLQIAVVANRDNDNAILTVPTSVKYINNQIVPWLDEKFEDILVSEIIISISGKQAIRLTNSSVTQAGIITTGYENINNNYNRKCANNYSRMPGDTQVIRQGTFTGGRMGVPINISITPDQIWDNGVYPTDQGAIQMKLEIKTSAPLHPDFSILIYKLYTNQMSFDTNLKATSTEWPSRVIFQGGVSNLQTSNVIPGN